MYKILFQGTQDHHIPGCEYNFGGAALVKCTAEILRHYMPGSIISSLMQLSPEYASKNNIRVIKTRRFMVRHYSFGESLRALSFVIRSALWLFLKKYLKLDWKFLVNNGRLKEYYDADIIIDLSMDCFNDSLGVWTTLDHCMDMMIGILLQKPVVIFAQSPGPFRNRLALWAAKYVLNRVSLITIREKASFAYLKKIGIKKELMHLTSDPAFIFKPAPIESIKPNLLKNHENPLIAVVPPEGILLNTQRHLKGFQSILMSGYLFLRYLLPEKVFYCLTDIIEKFKFLSGFRASKRNQVLSEIADIVDALSEKCNATVLLIPHVILPDKNVELDNDARTTIKGILKFVKNKDRVIPLIDNYSAEEVKSIIGQTEMLVSGKFHAAIAASSQNVPVLLMGCGWHHKMRGLMNMVGLEEYICEEISATSGLEKALILWKERNQLSNMLKKKMSTIKDGALLNGLLVKEMMAAKKR